MSRYNSTKKTIVTYNGKSGAYNYFKPMSDEKLASLREQFYAKPDFLEVKKQIKKGIQGGTQNNLITKYYFRELMSKTRVYPSNWSIEDAFTHKDILSIHYGKIYQQNFFLSESKTTEENEFSKLLTSFRLGGSSICAMPTNFPVKTVDKILQKYNINNNYYDPSCGWGARLFSSMKNNVNYYGTDPNYLLIEKLQEFANDFESQAGFFFPKVSLRCSGSEVLQEDLINKIGVVFTSPPYFLLEDYKIGNQSANQNTNYDDWLENYLRPTFKNIYKYLVKDGNCLINIADYKKFTLVDDTIRIAEECGFKLVATENLSLVNRPTLDKIGIDKKEGILVFKRIEDC